MLPNENRQTFLKLNRKEIHRKSRCKKSVQLKKIFERRHFFFNFGMNP